MAVGVPTCQAKFLSHDSATMAAAKGESHDSAALRPSDPGGGEPWAQTSHRQASSILPRAGGTLLREDQELGIVESKYALWKEKDKRKVQLYPIHFNYL